MGLILDSSIVIAAERRRDTVADLLKQIVLTTGDQEAALSSVGLIELVHGIYRAQTPEVRTRRESFIQELLGSLDRCNRAIERLRSTYSECPAFPADSR